MSTWRTIRTLFLGITLGTAWPVIMHGDAYQIPRGQRLSGFFQDPGGAIYSEHALELEFFRFAAAALITFILFAVYWSRKRTNMAQGGVVGLPVAGRSDRPRD